jgi:hypothetical protein
MKENDIKCNEHKEDIEKILERAAVKAAKEAFEKGILKIDAVHLKSAKEIFKKAIEAIEAAETAIIASEETLEYIESIGTAEAMFTKLNADKKCLFEKQGQNQP